MSPVKLHWLWHEDPVATQQVPSVSRCDGVIQNNLVRNNLAIGYYYPGDNTPAAGAAFFQCKGTIRNNTVVDNFIGNEWEPEKPKRPGGFKDCTAAIVNNIVYHTTMTTPLEYEGSSAPIWCLFRDARPGNIAGDPRFVNPAPGPSAISPSRAAIAPSSTSAPSNPSIPTPSAPPPGTATIRAQSRF